MGISTVYRYFTNKDAILLDPIEGNIGALADQFQARPEHEGVPVSLGWTVHAVLDVGPEHWARMRRLRAAGSRARTQGAAVGRVESGAVAAGGSDRGA